MKKRILMVSAAALGISFSNAAWSDEVMMLSEGEMDQLTAGAQIVRPSPAFGIIASDALAGDSPLSLTDTKAVSIANEGQPLGWSRSGRVFGASSGTALASTPGDRNGSRFTSVTPTSGAIGNNVRTKTITWHADGLSTSISGGFSVTYSLGNFLLGDSPR